MSKILTCDLCGESADEKNYEGVPGIHECWLTVKSSELFSRRMDVCPDCRKNEPIRELVVKQERLEKNRIDAEEKHDQD